MSNTASAKFEHFDRAALQKAQLERLNSLLLDVRDRPFYGKRLQQVTLPIDSLSHLSRLPLLSKSELIAESPQKPGRIFDLPIEQYTRLHQTSGTRGWPLPVLDTPSDWQWWLDCWQYVLDAASVTDHDIAMMAFSFGPFIGFWTANDAVIRRGTLVVPGGGMTSEARLKMILDYRCTLLCCTPTYALHLIGVAKMHGINLAESHVTRLIVAGEPGGSIPSIRNRIEQGWGASVIDHAGASELGAWGVGSSDGLGLHVIEPEFIAEVLRFDLRHPEGIAVNDGELGELVLTNLGRLGGPAIRYRTGDIVRPRQNHGQACPFLWLDGGVIGRADDMIVIRGVNVFPSSIDAIIRELDAAVEYRILIDQVEEMDQLTIQMEGTIELAKQVAAQLRHRLALRIEVLSVEENSLPRFEAKARRLVDRRSAP